LHMGQALYRKYRSKSFSEVIGQKHITDTLEKAIESDRISHAYLFTGPRGVGKTSVARILAYAVNGLDYANEEMHLDIIEIDAASNRRIDEIRDLRDKVNITPTSAKYKVYIIDEVHMLTREAFNALLKTLEEPPQHVIFILATTESHKLPETIISRTQRYNFKPFDIKTATEYLASIAKKEKIKASPEALELLAEFGDGSFRDSISLLDQLSSAGEEITAELVRQRLGLPQQSAIDGLLAAVDSGDSRKVLEIVSSLRDQAMDASNVSRLIAKRIRDDIANGEVKDYYTGLLKELLLVNSSLRPLDSLEIALLEVASNATKLESGSKPVEQATEPEPQPEPETETEPTAKEVETETRSSASEAGPVNDDTWLQIMSEIKSTAPSIYTALRLAKPRQEEEALILAFEFPLHQKKVELAKNKDLVARAVETVTGNKLIVRCIIDKQAFKNKAEVKVQEKPKPAEVTPSPEPQLQTINNIFGSAEVLES
jgi:DNA polymerase-3 subunit gamma/tau